MEYYDAAASTISQPKQLDNQSFYSQVIGWTAAAFASLAVGSAVLGPVIPQSMLMPLYFVALGALIIAGFTKKSSNPVFSGTFAIAIPAILGAILYPTLDYYFSTGQGDIVISAAVGAVAIFGLMGAWGWVSKKDISGWLPKMFFILIGLIVVSLLNVFVFQLTGLSFLISVGVLALFSVYTFIDLQLVKNRGMGDKPASFYALNLFLDLYNMFIAILNILGIMRN